MALDLIASKVVTTTVILDLVRVVLAKVRDDTRDVALKVMLVACSVPPQDFCGFSISKSVTCDLIFHAYTTPES
jgi:hypothetical protein